MPISAFGIWAALIVLCNYILVITLYPTLVLIHYHYVQPFERKYCCCCCGKEEDTAKNTKNIEPDIGTEIELGKKNEDQRDADIPPNLERQKSVEEQSVNYGCLERFFALSWAGWITMIRIPVLIGFATLFGIVIWRASLLEEQDEDETFFSSNHYMQRTQDTSDSFSAAQESGLVYVITIWGVNGVNRDGSNYWDPEDYGKVKWDNNFDISSPDSQEYLYDSCVELQESDLAFQSSSVFCPMSYFKQYLEAINETFPFVYTNDTNAYDDDIQQEMFIDKMIEFMDSNYALFLNAYGLVFIDDTDEDNPILR